MGGGGRGGSTDGKTKRRYAQHVKVTGLLIHKGKQLGGKHRTSNQNTSGRGGIYTPRPVNRCIEWGHPSRSLHLHRINLHVKGDAAGFEIVDVDNRY